MTLNPRIVILDGRARTPLVMTERKSHPPAPVGGAKLSAVEWGHGVSNKVLLVL